MVADRFEIRGELTDRMLKTVSLFTRPPWRLHRPPTLSLPRKPLCPGTRRSSGKAAVREEAEVEVKVERKPECFHLSLGLSLNLPIPLAGCFSVLLDRDRVVT